MRDVLYLSLIVAFFVLASAFVVACDRMIGSDDEGVDP